MLGRRCAASSLRLLLREFAGLLELGMLLIALYARVAACAGIRLYTYPKLFCTGLVSWAGIGDLGWAYAEKSAAAVAEMAASAESLACQTAPLWPRNVPILVGC